MSEMMEVTEQPATTEEPEQKPSAEETSKPAEEAKVLFVYRYHLFSHFSLPLSIHSLLSFCRSCNTFHCNIYFFQPEETTTPPAAVTATAGAPPAAATADEAKAAEPTPQAVPPETTETAAETEKKEVNEYGLSQVVLGVVL